MANPTFRQSLVNGEPVVGIITNLDSLDLIEIIANCGYDYVLLDAEHAAFSDDRLLMMLRTAHGAGLPAIVRVRDDHPKSILRVCDLGADGVMVPQIESAEQARAVVAAMRYAPLGERGLHPSTPGANWGSHGLDEHIERQNSGICSLLQIETKAGVDNIAEIVAVPGVDAVIVGPADLSQSLGVIGQTMHPDVEAASDKVLEAALAAGVQYGTVASTAERVAELGQRGVTFITTGATGVIVKGLTEQAKALKGAFSS